MAASSADLSAGSGGKRRFVAGVDFGTTFTSVAWAYTGSPNPSLVQDWPGIGKSCPTADQVPTQIQYPNGSSESEKIQWGWELSKAKKPSADVLKWFKLLLENKLSVAKTQVGQNTGSTGSRERSPSASSVDSLGSILDDLNISSKENDFPPPEENTLESSPAQASARILEKMGLNAVDVIQEFLSRVREQTQEAMVRKYGNEFVQKCPTEWVLTIPAIWSDAARQRMVDAATKAGFGTHREDFRLVSEPEAAAAYTLKEIQPNNLNVDDTFVICDAGGGTVDLISYKITGIDPLRIKMSVLGTGGLCGSVYLDQRFEKYMQWKFGDQVLENMKKRPRAYREMLRTWEQDVKFMFGSDEGEYGYDIAVQKFEDDESRNVRDEFHTMKREDVQRIFDPFVDRIVKLVQAQVTAVQQNGENVAAILLVGGFGSSEYLYKRLRDTTYGSARTRIEVLQPKNAQTAIARGALIRGLEGSAVTERRVPLHYGCSASIPYIPGLGPEAARRMTLDWLTGQRMIDGHLSWYMHKNDALTESFSGSHKFYVNIPASFSPSDLIYRCSLLHCEEDTPPEFEWENEKAIEKTCTLLANLGDIPTSKMHKCHNAAGGVYYKIYFDLKMTVVDEVIKFELVFEGQTYGSVTTKFE